MNLRKFLLLMLYAILGASHLHATSRFQPGRSEAEIAYGVRLGAACQSTLAQPPFDIEQNNNGDETNVADYAGQFTKLLEHNPVTSAPSPFGQQQYEQFVKAINSGLQADFNAMVLTPGIQRLLVNPQAALAWTLQGIDSSLPPMPIAPSVTSPVAAAEVLEVYLQAICRDVEFKDYGTGENSDKDTDGGSITEKAASVLTALLPNYTGPTQNGVVTPQVLFRGSSKGDLVGPYVSQYLLQPIYPLFPSGCAPFVAGIIGVQNLDTDVMAVPQHLPIPGNREFGVSWQDFIAIQNGFIPKEYVLNDYNQTMVRYPIDGRDMGGLVHTDGPYQAYYNAMNILTYRNCPIDPSFPYANGSITNEAPGITMAGIDAYGLVGGVCIAAFKCAWAEKWRAQRRLRPEAMGGLIHHAKVTDTNPYNLDPSVFATYNGINVLEWTKLRNSEQAAFPANNLTIAEASTYLLPQMYPEGSPAHPSYPAGHGTVAGACTTVIKAIFDDVKPINELFTPVIVDPTDPTQLVPLLGEHEMTVGSELDKLASNIALARDFGGVHYRSDSLNGVALGEEIAIRYLQDQARTYTEQGFTGFELTKRDGVRIRITATDVEVIG